ncbi:MAG TPA: hypothetical protein VI524_09735 [Anaerolineales bacterium]|jgi:hypothetical protein|nr:hypothetical protein [Anaerolineales bacterium]
MLSEAQSNDKITATIRGPVSGQIAVGKGITQISAPGWTARPSEAELASLRQAFAELREQVSAGSPPEKQPAALERVDELEEAITSSEPDLSTMEYVKVWFGKNLPGLAGAVTGLIVHPVVGKLVEAAGDVLAAEFRRRFAV